MTEYIRDAYGRVYGTINHLSNGDKEARDYYGKIMGYYKKSQDVTTDFYGKILGRGDFVVAFICPPVK